MKTLLQMVLFISCLLTSAFSADFSLHSQSLKPQLSSSVVNSYGRVVLKDDDYLYVIGDADNNQTTFLKTDYNLHQKIKKEYILDTQYKPLENIYTAIFTEDKDAIVMLGAFQYSGDASFTYLRKIDLNGNVIFTKKYQNMTQSGSRELAGYDIAQLSNKGFVIVGSYYDINYNGGALILKVDAEGEEISREYIGSYSFNNEDYNVLSSHNVAAMSNGGFIMSAYAYSDLKKSALVYKVDEVGNKTLLKEYKNKDWDSSIKDLKAIDNKAHYTVATGFGGTQVYFEELDLASNTITRLKEIDSASSFIALENGGWLFSAYYPPYGDTLPTQYFIKYDESLNLVYEKKIDVTDSLTPFSNYIQMLDGVFIATGRSGSDFFVSKFLDNIASNTYRHILDAPLGWSLLSSLENIADFKMLDGYLLWKYDNTNKQWLGYCNDLSLITSNENSTFSRLDQKEGFWIRK